MFEFLYFLFMVGLVLTLGPIVFQFTIALVFGVIALVVAAVQKVVL